MYYASYAEIYSTVIVNGFLLDRIVKEFSFQNLYSQFSTVSMYYFVIFLIIITNIYILPHHLRCLTHRKFLKLSVSSKRKIMPSKLQRCDLNGVLISPIYHLGTK